MTTEQKKKYEEQAGKLYPHHRITQEHNDCYCAYLKGAEHAQSQENETLKERVKEWSEHAECRQCTIVNQNAELSSLREQLDKAKSLLGDVLCNHEQYGYLTVQTERALRELIDRK